MGSASAARSNGATAALPGVAEVAPIDGKAAAPFDGDVAAGTLGGDTAAGPLDGDAAAAPIDGDAEVGPLDGDAARPIDDDAEATFGEGATTTPRGLPAAAKMHRSPCPESLRKVPMKPPAAV